MLLGKLLRNSAFHVKTSQSAKNELDPTKNENWPKKAMYALFAQKLSIVTRLCDQYQDQF